MYKYIKLIPFVVMKELKKKTAIKLRQVKLSAGV
jgi:hypothetical protein